MMNVLRGYRDFSKLSSEDESEDSDKECADWKRATKRVHEDQILQKIQVHEVTAEPCEKPAKRKRNTVWSDVLEDQLISDDLGGVLLKNKPANFGSRGHESYDYTLKYADSENSKDLDCVMSEDALPESENKSVSSDHSTNSFKSNKFVPLDGSEKDAVYKINKVLNEKKFYLICRIVKYVGIEKSMSLLKMTEEIEENGGMMIQNNARRRTPGGVYIQLLKSDKDITQEMQDKIFEGEIPCKELKKYYNQQRKRKNRFKAEKVLNKSKENPPDARICIIRKSPCYEFFEPFIPIYWKFQGSINTFESLELCNIFLCCLNRILRTRFAETAYIKVQQYYQQTKTSYFNPFLDHSQNTDMNIVKDIQGKNDKKITSLKEMKILRENLENLRLYFTQKPQYLY